MKLSFSVTYHKRQMIDLIIPLCIYQEAECEKEKMDVAYQAQTNIADSSREFQMQKAAFDQEVNARKAEAELSYELQVHCRTLFCVKQRRIAWNKISGGSFSFHDGDGSEHITIFNGQFFWSCIFKECIQVQKRKS